MEKGSGKTSPTPQKGYQHVLLSTKLASIPIHIERKPHTYQSESECTINRVKGTDVITQFSVKGVRPRSYTFHHYDRKDLASYIVVSSIYDDNDTRLHRFRSSDTFAFDLKLFHEAVNMIASMNFSKMSEAAKTIDTIKVIDITANSKLESIDQRVVSKQEKSLELKDFEGIVYIDPGTVAMGRMTNKGISFSKLLIADTVFNRRVVSGDAWYGKFRPKPSYAYNVWRMSLAAPTISESEKPMIAGVLAAQLNFTDIYHSPILGSRSMYGPQYFNEKLSKTLISVYLSKKLTRSGRALLKSTSRIVSVVPLEGFIMCYSSLSEKLRKEALTTVYYATSLDSHLGTYNTSIVDYNDQPVYYVMIPPGFGKSSVKQMLQAKADSNEKFMDTNLIWSDIGIVDLDSITPGAEVSPFDLSDSDYTKAIVDWLHLIQSFKRPGPTMLLIHSQDELPKLGDLIGLNVRFVFGGFIKFSTAFKFRVLGKRNQKIFSLSWFYDFSTKDRERLLSLLKSSIVVTFSGDGLRRQGLLRVPPPRHEVSVGSNLNDDMEYVELSMIHDVKWKSADSRENFHILMIKIMRKYGMLVTFENVDLLIDELLASEFHEFVSTTVKDFQDLDVDIKASVLLKAYNGQLNIPYFVKGMKSMAKMLITNSSITKDDYRGSELSESINDVLLAMFKLPMEKTAATPFDMMVIYRTILASASEHVEEDIDMEWADLPKLWGDYTREKVSEYLIEKQTIEPSDDYRRKRLGLKERTTCSSYEDVRNEVLEMYRECYNSYRKLRFKQSRLRYVAINDEFQIDHPYYDNYSTPILLELKVPEIGDTVFCPASRSTLYRADAIYFTNVNTIIMNLSIFTRKKPLAAVVEKLLLKADGVDVSGHFYPTTLLPVLHFCMNIISSVLNLLHLYHGRWVYQWTGQPEVWHTERDYDLAMKLVTKYYDGQYGTLKVTSRRLTLMEVFVKVVPELVTLGQDLKNDSEPVLQLENIIVKLLYSYLDSLSDA